MSDTRSADGPMLIVVDGAHADAGGGDAHGSGTDAAASSLSGDAVVGEAFDAAVALLRGSFANYILCCSAMAISCAFTLVGFVMMTEGDSTSRTLLVVSMFFLLSQTFTLAKASRDKAMVAMALRDPTGPKVDESLCSNKGVSRTSPVFLYHRCWFQSVFLVRD